MARALVVQMRDRGKWHRVWWLREWESQGRMALHVGGFFDPERHPIKPKDEVQPADLCRSCFPSVNPTPPATTSGSDR